MAWRERSLSKECATSPRFQGDGNTGGLDNTYLAKRAALYKLYALEVALARVQLLFHQNGPLEVLLNLLLQLQDRIK